MMSIVRILIPLIAGWVICRAVGPLWAGTIALVFSVCVTVAGAMTLRSLRVGEISWRNRVAGWMVPWGYRMTPGKLWVISLVSGAVWAALWGLGILLARPASDVAMTAAAPGWWTAELTNGLLILAWLVDGAALFWLAGQISQYSANNRQPGSTIFRVLVVVAALIVFSFGFWYLGHPRIALWVAGFPPLLAGTLFGVWTALLLTMGRKARWN